MLVCVKLHYLRLDLIRISSLEEMGEMAGDKDTDITQDLHTRHMLCAVFLISLQYIFYVTANSTNHA